MALSASVAITIAIICALCTVVIAAAIHRVVTDKATTFDENGAPRSKAQAWIPNKYSPEQLRRLDEVRWVNKKILWEVARHDRLERGVMELPDWYPGHEWKYEPGTRFSKAASDASASTTMLNFDFLEQDIINNPGNIGHAYRIPYQSNGGPDSDEDDYGLPPDNTPAPNTKRNVPHLLRRWTQHGPSLRTRNTASAHHGNDVPHITINDEPLSPVEEDEYVYPSPGIRMEIVPRSSSIYTGTVFGETPPTPTLTAFSREIPVEAETYQRPKRTEQSRVHVMIEQWERANGMFS